MLLEKFASANQKLHPYQFGISALLSQTSLCAETSGGVAKCSLFSQVSALAAGIFENGEGVLSRKNIGRKSRRVYVVA